MRFRTAEYDLEVNPPLYVLNEGEKMEIHCSAQGAHEISNTDLEWFFRPVGSSSLQPLDFGPGGFVRTDDPRARYTSVITKYHVTALDEGEYVCREPRGQTGFSSLQIREFIYFSLSSDVLLNKHLLPLWCFPSQRQMCHSFRKC